MEASLSQINDFRPTQAFGSGRGRARQRPLLLGGGASLALQLIRRRIRCPLAVEPPLIGTEYT